MYNFDSTREELNAAITRIVGSIRTPDINFDEYPLFWLGGSGKYAEWEQAPYLKLYKELLDPYFYSSNLEPNPGCDETFGFQSREINHPVLNMMMLDVRRLHYKFMEPIIKKVRKELDREERKRGQKYNDADYWWMVRDRAIEIRLKEQESTTTNMFKHIARTVEVKFQREQEQHRREEQIIAAESPTSMSSSVQSFRQEHPLLSGLLAGFLLVKAKHLFDR